MVRIYKQCFKISIDMRLFFYRKMFCSLSRAVHVHIISKILLLFPPYLCVWIEILEKSLWYGLYSIVFSCFISILFWKGTIKTYCLNICFLHFFLDNEIFIQSKSNFSCTQFTYKIYNKIMGTYLFYTIISIKNQFNI